MSRKKREHDTLSNNSGRKHAKKLALQTLIMLAIILLFSLTGTVIFLSEFIPRQYLIYVQISEIAVVGYFAVEIVSTTFYKLATGYLDQTAKSIKVLIRIAGAILIVAIIISYLSRDPVVAASISTISGLVIGFASQTVIGNMIAGLYLALMRPFKIGDRITVFGNTGIIADLGLFYSRLVMDNGDFVIASNSSMVATTVVLHRQHVGDQ
jgi:small conductance mechanosensitive channel